MAHAAKTIIVFTFSGDSVQKVTPGSHAKKKGPDNKLGRASIPVPAVSPTEVHPALPCEAAASTVG